MSNRDTILGSIRRSLRRGPVDGRARAALEARIEGHTRGPRISRVDRDADALLALFADKIEAAAATFDRVNAVDDVPVAVADYLAGENLPTELVAAPDPNIEDIPWTERPLLTIRQGAPRNEDKVGVTGVFAGVAETGTLMLTSGPQSPSTLNFMPDTHIVVLRRDQVVGPFEDAWDRLRAEQDSMPRTVNFITGPSRSGDIGQQLEMGAHGPRRLHVILIDGSDEVPIDGEEAESR
jgi:L-lactate dehydrogenase complex protein LldG